MRASDYARWVDRASAPAGEPSRSLRDRLVPPMPPTSWWAWAGPLLVTVFGGVLRFYRLGISHAGVFDETYSVPDGRSILRHGVGVTHPREVKALVVGASTHIVNRPPGCIGHPT